MKQKIDSTIVPYHLTWDITDSSKLITFLNCPRKYFYEYILGWRPETPSNHLVFGRSWHIAMEYLLNHDYSGPNVARAFEAFLEDYRRTFSPETDQLFEPKSPEKAELILYAYAAKYADDLKRFEPLYVEIAGTVAVAEDRLLHFRMDSICQDRETGDIFSLEHKTGSRLWRWEEQWPLSVQVGTYTHVLYCLYPQEQVKGIKMNAAFFMNAPRAWDAWMSGNRGKYKPPFDFMRVPVYRSPDQMAVWMWNITHWLDMLEWNFQLFLKADQNEKVMTCFPMNTTSCSNYSGCPYKDFCSAWPNPLRRCEEPPLGFCIERWDPSEDEASKVFNIDHEGEVK